MLTLICVNHVNPGLKQYLGRLIEKIVPAKGKMSIVYDPLNRPVLMQDALMNSNNQWNYIRYDVKGRAISQGIYTDATHLGRSAMQSYVTGLATTYNTTYYESRNTTQSTGYYTATVFPTSATGTIAPLAYAYFDDYKLNPSGTAYSYVSQSLSGEETATTAPVKGMPTMVRKTTVGASLSGYWLLNATFYDKRLHPIQTQSNNQLNYTVDVLTDNSTTAPDFMGAPLITSTKKNTGTTVTVQTSITYDYFYRVKTVDQTYNGGAVNHIAAYAYNEMEQLVTKNLGQVSSGVIPANLTLSSYSATTAVATGNIYLNTGFTSTPGASFNGYISTGYLQTLDLRYNIRGQLTSMNNSRLLNDNGITNGDNTDVFGMQLMYDQVDAGLSNTPYYDGKVSAVKWMSVDATGNHSNERGYNYSYDALNRYTGATYGERTAGSTGSFSTNSGGFNETVTYDIGGSVQSLYRNAILTSGGSPVEIDHLTYGYSTTNPNRLNSISETNDANHNAAGFRYIAATSGSYSYDVNGSLTADPYKGITSIAYNYLNKTDKITLSATQYINYIYDGAGMLIRKQQTSGSTVTTTDYIDGFVYNNTSGATALAYFAMPEGRVLNNSGTLVDEFIIGDQQGNARVSFQNNGSGLAVVKQENSYYPTGLIMPNSPVATPSVPNKNLYNGGSEWQNDFGNLPDYYETYYRNYDAAIYRWTAVDPQAESVVSMTPYQYVGNNPVMFNDPLGNKWPTPPKYLDDGPDPQAPGPGRINFDVDVPVVGSNDSGDETDENSPDINAGYSEIDPNLASTDSGFSPPGYATDFHWPGGGTLHVDDGSNLVFDVRPDGSLKYISGNIENWPDQTLINYYKGLYTGLTGTIAAGVAVVNDKVSQKGSVNNVVDGQGVFNKQIAIQWMRDNTGFAACGSCATFVRQGLEAGFGLIPNALKGILPVPARLYGPSLRKFGFQPINTTNYQAGDIAVMDGVPGSKADPNTGIPYGHIAMFDGNIWISDFKQDGDFYPGSKYQNFAPNYQIYRYGK